MADLLSRIVGPVAVASGTSTIFTGTNLHTYTVKQIRIVNNTTGGINIKIGIGGVTDALLILHDVTIPGKSTFTDSGLWVVKNTETVQASAGTTGLTISLHGLDQV